MTYQTILVNMSDEATSATVLNVADRLAERHTAHLLGLHVKPAMSNLFLSSAEMPLPEEVARSFLDQQYQVESRVKAQFDQTTDSASYVADWRSIDVGLQSVADELVAQGNTADLIVLGQSEYEATRVHSRYLSETVLLACGRPVLVVPWQYEASRIAERVMLAWDGRRESTRALFGALPLLRHASEVRLHRMNLPHQDRRHVVGVTEELANTLARHGVSLEVHHSDARSSEIADELIAYARDMDADMLVMGCYGHSRIREFLLGGTTRQVFSETTIPVLMSN